MQISQVFSATKTCPSHYTSLTIPILWVRKGSEFVRVHMHMETFRLLNSEMWGKMQIRPNF